MELKPQDLRASLPILGGYKYVVGRGVQGLSI